MYMYIHVKFWHTALISFGIKTQGAFERILQLWLMIDILILFIKVVKKHQHHQNHKKSHTHKHKKYRKPKTLVKKSYAR